MHSDMDASRPGKSLTTKLDHAGSADAGLMQFVRGLVVGGLPQRGVRARPTPVVRRWAPLAQPRLSGITFLERNPALTFAFEGLPETHVPQRLGGRGMRKRTNVSATGRAARASNDLLFRALREAEVHPDVLAHVENPVVLTFEDGGKLRRYTPSLLVSRSDGLWFQEVMAEGRAATAEKEERHRTIGEALSTAGYGFEVVSELHLEAEPRRSNVDEIFRARHLTVDFEHALGIASGLRHRGDIPIADVMDLFGIEFHGALFLLRRGVLSTDLDAASLAPTSLVRFRRVPAQTAIRW